jgi:hypothetical protein
MIDANENPLAANRRTHIVNQFAVRMQPLLIWPVVIKIAFEQDHARGSQVPQQGTVALVQLHCGPQSDQEVITC